jgi:hypothetical protein
MINGAAAGVAKLAGHILRIGRRAIQIPDSVKKHL